MQNRHRKYLVRTTWRLNPALLAVRQQCYTSQTWAFYIQRATHGDPTRFTVCQTNTKTSIYAANTIHMCDFYVFTLSVFILVALTDLNLSESGKQHSKICENYIINCLIDCRSITTTVVRSKYHCLMHLIIWYALFMKICPFILHLVHCLRQFFFNKNK